MNQWKYNDEIITQDFFGVNHKECPHYSFLYSIKSIDTGKEYIGKKILWSKRSLPPLKGKLKKRIVYKVSDWEKYFGSSKYLNVDIEKYGTDRFTRTIIGLYPDKREANFAELRYQILFNVLDAVDESGERLYYNENIDRIYYPSKNYGIARSDELDKWVSIIHNKDIHRH